MSVRVRLVLASTLMLLLELALIRWCGAEVVHLSYFSNFVLLGSFLGIGLGFLRAGKRDRGLPYYSPVALLALVGFLSAYPVTVDRTSSSVIFFTSLGTSGPPIWLTLPLIFLAVAAIMAGPGELVGRCFHELPRLDAYRYDLLGSLAGIAIFTACSFVGAPPLVWFGMVGVLFVILFRPRGRGVAVTLAVALLAMFGYPLTQDDVDEFWSPYYRVNTYEGVGADGSREWNIFVNGIPHQKLTSAESRLATEPWYDEPYLRIPDDPERVLIVGAGTGTDVSIALTHGVEHVDAVEIDPGLLSFGREHSPARTYDDPRVTTHVNDGRAFLERSDEKYDLILFALPDSLTLVSGASALRLESFLFTREAMESARDHLAPGGAFSMYNFYREPWLVDRLAGTMTEVFGHSPCLLSSPEAISLAVMVAGLTPQDQVCEATWSPDSVASASVPPPSTDDHPFLYVRDGDGLFGIPMLYVVALALILLVSAVAVAVVGGREARGMWAYRDLFLLGAAFLLLETKSITGFALYFGTTWLVNALVFAGVLVAVLAAVEITRRFEVPPLRTMYAVLFGGLAVAWAVPTSWVLGLPVLPRLIVAVVLAFIPIMAANVIFAQRFATTLNPTTAFGANLLGAMLGGCLEYLALATGYRSLLVVCALLYLGAYLTAPAGSLTARSLASTPAART